MCDPSEHREFTVWEPALKPVALVGNSVQASNEPLRERGASSSTGPAVVSTVFCGHDRAGIAQAVSDWIAVLTAEGDRRLRAAPARIVRLWIYRPSANPVRRIQLWAGVSDLTMRNQGSDLVRGWAM